MIDKERLDRIEFRINQAREERGDEIDQVEEDREYLFRVILELIKDSAAEILTKLSGN